MKKMKRMISWMLGLMICGSCFAYNAAWVEKRAGDMVAILSKQFTLTEEQKATVLQALQEKESAVDAAKAAGTIAAKRPEILRKFKKDLMAVTGATKQEMNGILNEFYGIMKK